MRQASRRRFHYIYKTTCLVTNRYYVGMHSTDDLNDGYMGSGIRLRRSIKKHGIQQHRREILEQFENRAILREHEKELVNEKLIADPLCMNIARGGEGGWDYVNSLGCLGPEKQKLLMLDPVYRARRLVQLHVAVKAAQLKNHQKRLEGKLTCFAGKKHSIDSRKQMSFTHQKRHNQVGSKNSQFGTKWITDGKDSRKISKNEACPPGWEAGRIMKNSMPR